MKTIAVGSLYPVPVTKPTKAELRKLFKSKTRFWVLKKNK